MQFLSYNKYPYHKHLYLLIIQKFEDYTWRKTEIQGSSITLQCWKYVSFFFCSHVLEVFGSLVLHYWISSLVHKHERILWFCAHSNKRVKAKNNWGLYRIYPLLALSLFCCNWDWKYYYIVLNKLQPNKLKECLSKPF